MGSATLSSALVAFFDLNMFANTGGLIPLSPDRSDNLLMTLWQVEVAISAVALPLLILGVDLVRDRPGAAVTSQQVLLRESFLFPILLLGLFLAIRVGVDAFWFASPAVAIVDLILVGTLVILTAAAFARSLRLIHFRAELKEAAVRYILERMGRVVYASLLRRVANHTLLGELQKVGVGYYPFVPNTNEPGYVVVQLGLRGILTDVALGQLISILRTLTPSPPAGLGQGVGSAPTPGSRSAFTHSVWITKLIGDEVSDSDPSLIRLDVAAVGGQDIQLLRRSIERVVRVR